MTTTEPSLFDGLEAAVSADAPPPQPQPPVEIRVSTRRRKTVAAHWEGDTVVVLAPARMSRRDREAYADHLAARLVAARERSRPTDAALTARAAELSQRYLGGAAVPSAVTWSARQTRCWGTCTPADRTIRISDRLQGVPPWVLDAVLVHELAHLLHADHGGPFGELVARYPRTADADLFLEGFSLGLGARGR